MESDPVLVHDWLARSARRAPEKVALVCGQARWTYAKLNAYAARFAQALVDLGVRRHDRVAILTGNCPETVVCLYGVLKAGGVFVILDGNTRARRLKYVLGNCGARVLVARSNQAGVVQEALGQLDGDFRIVWTGAGADAGACPDASGVTWDSIFAASGKEGLGRQTTVEDRLCESVDVDLAALIYTSGTTGKPKGVMCTHWNMVSAAKSIIRYLGNTEDDVILDVLPLSFGYGLYQVLTSCMFGGTVVLERSFLYPHVTLKRIAEEKATALPLVPSMAAMVLRIDNIGDYDFGTLRYITSAGAAMPVGHLGRLRRLIPDAQLFNMYGLTECVRVCYLTGEALDARPGSVGGPMPNCEVRIVNEAGEDVARGEVGELLIRGANVMQGYWDDPETSARAYESGRYPVSRWLHSGDYFRQDEEGYLYFCSRKDDMIKTRGERVSPKEVEDVVCELEDVAEAAVVGVPDDILGQAIKIFVVCRRKELTEKDVLRHCVRHLEPLMVPKHAALLETLPKTEHGKIDRRKLRTL